MYRVSRFNMMGVATSLHEAPLGTQVIKETLSRDMQDKFTAARMYLEGAAKPRLHPYMSFQELESLVTYGEPRTKPRPEDRYVDITPFPFNALSVIQNGRSQYINASAIEVTLANKAPLRIIATQGPLGPAELRSTSTINDFYDLIEQSGSSAIVSLGDPLGQCGASKYTAPWDKWHVKSASLSSKRRISVSELAKTLIKQDEQALLERTFRFSGLPHEEPTELRHFHLSGWPDRAAANLEVFAKLLKELQLVLTHHPQRPVVIHCSAGVGRTGSLSAALWVTEELRAMQMTPSNEEVDLLIEHAFLGLRQLRVCMVETPPQLEMLRTAMYNRHLNYLDKEPSTHR